MDQKVAQKFFRKFSQWYYVDAKKDLPLPDAPELVALLQAVGFKLSSIGYSGKGKSSSAQLAGLKVTLECAASGVIAELQAPPETPCRCAVFSNRQQPEEQASFWTITSSQEKMEKAGAIGSSLLPEIEPQRAVVIKEVFRLLQDELFEVPAATRTSGSLKRLSLPPLPPVPKFDSEGSSTSSSSIQRSAESLDKTLLEWPDQAQPAAGLPSQASSIIRRASFGCGADLKHVKPLPPQLPPKPQMLLSDTSLDESLAGSSVSERADATNLHHAKNDEIKRLLVTALELLGAKKTVTGGGTLERTTTFVLPEDEAAKDPARKKPKFVSTPGNVTRGGHAPLGRLPTPKPGGSRIFAPSPSPSMQKTTLRSTYSTPMPGLSSNSTQAKARATEFERRRSAMGLTSSTLQKGAAARPQRRSVLSPSVEEANTSLVQAAKSKLVKRASLPLRPLSTHAKENRPT